MIKRIIIYAILLSFVSPDKACTQDSAGVKKQRVSFKGYVKDMIMYMETPAGMDPVYANQLHNRMIFSWFPGKVVTGRVETRSRLFTGTLVHDFPVLEYALDQDPGIADLAFAESLGSYSLISLQLDRAWMGFRKGKWDITLGRQRINWGMNTIWNPNDIFNAYNFFDFDYEERPGSDALRVQYTTGGFSFLEGAVSKGATGEQVTAAMLYRFNTRGYDIQLLGGYSELRPVGGIGWAGSISNAGFKAEATWMGRSDERNESDRFLVSSGIDYTFDPGWYVNFAYLYNSAVNTTLTTLESNSLLISGSDPFPYEHALLLQVMKEINPIWNAGLTVMYTADETIAGLPYLSWSPATNWELLLYGQYFREPAEKTNPTINGFLRLKWSFATALRS